MDRYYILSVLFLFCTIQFSNAQGTLEKEADSIQRTYFESGIVSSEGFFKSDKKEGSWKYFYQNSELKAQGMYKYGLKEGEWMYYHDNGNLSSFGNYSEDLKEGIWEFYTINGPFLYDIKYHKGIEFFD